MTYNPKFKFILTNNKNKNGDNPKVLFCSSVKLTKCL